MKDIQAIARYMRLPEEQLKFPIELLNQGYEPNYLANYRPDELGNIDEHTLSVLKRALNYSEALKRHKLKVQENLERELQWNETVASAVAQSNTISQVDTIIRHLRSRKNSRSISEQCPQVETLGQAILTLQGDAPKDLHAWVAEVAGVTLEQAPHVLEETKRWMVHLLGEDVHLMQDLQRTILKKATISVKVLPDPPKGSDADKQLEKAENNTTASADLPTLEASPVPLAIDTPVADSPVADSPVADSPAADGIAGSVDAQTSNASEAIMPPEATEQVHTAEKVPSPEVPSEVAPLIADFNKGRKQPKELKTKTLSDKQLSPRQRRRKWLRSIVETYARLKKPLTHLTPYQILMLARGQRSQIVSLQFHCDERPMIQTCRESLCPGRHPMHTLLLQIAEDGFKHHIMPRLQQDVMAILEEDSHTDLTEAAVTHLQTSLLQRPIRGHRILVIDAVGPKMAAVTIVDADGKVLFTNELPCNSNRADVVAQNVVALGQWVHEHKVTLLALSNGPSRRYLIHTVSELMKQSSDGSLYWTMVDRAGADGYCMSRGCLVELPNISRRHRAATWLAWRLQDPLKQILKVEPARLRLGSYQRELPQQELESALKDAVSAAITQAGVDVFHADTEILKRIPGMTAEAAKAVVQACHDDKITHRESLMAVLREHLSEMHARQAIGFLKVFGSSNPLDATTIHPDDYRLAERLVEHAKLPMPASAPENWSKPNYAELAAAVAVASVEHAKQAADDSFAASIDTEPIVDEAFAAELIASEAESSNAAPVDAEVTSATPEIATQEVASAESTTESEPTSVESSEQSNEPVTDAAPAATTVVRQGIAMPTIPTGPMEHPPLSIDVERLARSWQVGREKMKRVANCLQYSYTDARDFQYPVPVQSSVPRLDTIKPGSLLQAMVIGVADFGVFVDLGPECSGLIHISRLAPDFIEDPHQFVQVGDLVPVWVLNVDEKKKRVSLTAIAPGTQRRSDQFGRDSDSSQDRNPRGNNQREGHQREGQGQGQANHRAPQGNRRPAPAREGGTNRPTSAGTAAPTSSDNRGSDNRRGAGGQRSGNRNEGQRGSGNRNRNSGGFDRDRRNQSQESNESGSRRPARVEPPKPVTPISDAMQQGKEPLRSFSDLLQFMKTTKEEPVVEQKSAPNVSGGEAPVVESSQTTGEANLAQESDNSVPPA